jgi:hypothetical protein
VRLCFINKLTRPFLRFLQFGPLIFVLASTILAIVSYLQALQYPFVSDDISYIVENSKLSELRLGELWRLFVEPYNDFSEFLPLRDLSYWFDITLFGQNPAAFRLHNIILYLVCRRWSMLRHWVYGDIFVKQIRKPVQLGEQQPSQHCLRCIPRL